MKKIFVVFMASMMVLSACGKKTGPIKPSTIESSYADAEQGYTVYPIGNTVNLKDWTVEFESYTPTTQLQSTNNRYFSVDDGYIMVLANLKVTNNSAEEKAFLPLTASIEGISAYLTPVDMAGDGAYEAENLPSYVHNPIDKTIPAGETDSINIIFIVKEEEVNSDTKWRLILEHNSAENEEEYEYIVFEF